MMMTKLMTWFIELQNRFNESRLFKISTIYVLNQVDDLTSWQSYSKSSEYFFFFFLFCCCCCFHFCFCFYFCFCFCFWVWFWVFICDCDTDIVLIIDSTHKDLCSLQISYLLISRANCISMSDCICMFFQWASDLFFQNCSFCRS